VRVELRVAEFDLAAAVQEDAEDDADGIGRDLAGGLSALGTVAASAATLQCGNAFVEVYSMKYAAPSGWIGFCQMSR
jgi:hypothetical protein